MEDDKRETLVDKLISDVEQNIKDDAAERSRISQQFFTQAPDDSAAAPELTTKRRKRNDAGLAALGAFARALQAMKPQERAAAIWWLVDRYLGSESARTADAVDPHS